MEIYFISLFKNKKLQSIKKTNHLNKDGHCLDRKTIYYKQFLKEIESVSSCGL